VVRLQENPQGQFSGVRLGGACESDVTFCLQHLNLNLDETGDGAKVFSADVVRIDALGDEAVGVVSPAADAHVYILDRVGPHSNGSQLHVPVDQAVVTFELDEPVVIGSDDGTIRIHSTHGTEIEASLRCHPP
jgi:hypothetical protein